MLDELQLLTKNKKSNDINYQIYLLLKGGKYFEGFNKYRTGQEIKKYEKEFSTTGLEDWFKGLGN